MFQKILSVLILAAGVFIAVVALQPADFRIARSTLIAAPPEAVFAEVHDFRHWRAWSPWEKRDPDMQRRYEGPPEGEGAIYAWSGNRDVGAGRNTIVESVPPRRIEMRLEFTRPLEVTNLVEFTFDPVGAATRVTWAMSGHNDFVAKAMDLLLNMDGMVGKDFEKGLAALKKVVEEAKR